jgi:cyclohexyl-isocyanide hydratase
MRWLFHVARRDDIVWGSDGRYRPASLAREGFLHASYADAVAESARLYFPGDAELRVLAIDARRLDAPVEVVATPRGDMPHVRGPIPVDAVRVVSLEAASEHPDVVTGTKIGFLAFDGMTLLDLVGPLDALSRIASMGFDPSTTCEVAALYATEDGVVWSSCGMEVRTARIHPALDAYDVLVVPGGLATRALATDPAIATYLRTFPKNRLIASVCTGALLLGAAGRLEGLRATTHASALDALEAYGARAVRRRVADELQVVTAGGVTAGIDLGLHLVSRLTDHETATRIAQQMEATW